MGDRRYALANRFIPAPAGNAAPDRAQGRLRPVHPRACGERASHWSTHPDAAGSSPRLRGTHSVAEGLQRGVRFIPAPAGNAGIRAAKSSASTVHPRACGERASLGQTASFYNGSSPRLRGTLGRPRVRAPKTRFIPAPAGNAWMVSPNGGGSSVHPRACGERGMSSVKPATFSGSSPRLRGTPAPPDAGAMRIRFIPAPAGNARSRRRSRWCRPVHPRACGERYRVSDTVITDFGSSPRLRGTPADGAGGGGLSRFIPAPAGNAIDEGAQEAKTPVHPRACGERSMPGCGVASAVGSSPRLRGTPTSGSSPTKYQRFIPAPAGNARRTAPPSRSRTVHPRACGERLLHPVPSADGLGSSPRLRGTRAERLPYPRRRRFIPAPAGNATVVRVRRAGTTVHPRACGERLALISASSP